jgi:signal-transduction protein with cAMP-binding, CBS, and nucleotidyltransferase domain
MIAARPLAETLASVPFFSGLDAAGLESVGRTVRTRRFRRGEVIFHQGDPGDALFIVMNGGIKISLPSDTGDEAILATLRSGDVFGELALLDGAPRSATATAIESKGRSRTVFSRWARVAAPSFLTSLSTASVKQVINSLSVVGSLPR